MNDGNESLGTIEHQGDQYVARLERQIDHPPADVWAMLTDPARFVDWLAPGEIELIEGGAARLNFVDSGIVIDSRVTACEAERVLEYSWSGPGEPERPVRYEITSTEPGACCLTLTLTAPDDEDMARSAAGWEAHLMMLLAALEGVPIKFPFERFQSTREAYNQQLAD